MRVPEPPESVFGLHTVQGSTYLLHHGSDLINRTLRGGAVWEERTVQLAHLLLQGVAQPVVLDIGANLGAFAVPLGQHLAARGGQLHAFEPQRMVFYQLCANLLVNRLSHCQAHALALGNQVGSLEVPVLDHAYCDNLGAVSLEATRSQQQWRGRAGIATARVPLVTLDSLTDLPAAHLIKIDVEGMELEVVQGAQAYLARSHYPPLLFEVWGDYEAAFIPKRERLLALVRSLGYQTWLLGELCVAQHPFNTRVAVDRLAHGNFALRAAPPVDSDAAVQRVPPGWDAPAQHAWGQGQQQLAVDRVLARINQATGATAVELFLQLAYYMFLHGDFASAVQCLEIARQNQPQHRQVLLNLAVCLGRCERFAEAVQHLQTVHALEPDNAAVHDGLAKAYAKLQRYDEARVAGTRALVLKAVAVASALPWELPAGSPQAFAQAPGKRDVIAFSLWGDHPRYLRGAVHNALVAPTLYPGWQLRFYVDATVPTDVITALRELGADVRIQPAGQTQRQRLAWRFQVANDAQVGRFLVRDADAVLNPRERRAVQAWEASQFWFHAMRDWWTHTDLLLAGMWGGVAGVLPTLDALQNHYVAPDMETPNIDQWFLRDRVWPCVQTSCLVHDRCFAPPGAQPWPDPDPAHGVHVGQCVFTAHPAVQEAQLARWIARLPSLQLAHRMHA